MRQANRPFPALTAGDVMSRAAMVLPGGMSLAGAARLLTEQQLSLAPVVDALGRCVGVLSARDVLRWAAAREQEPAPHEGVWCDWQVVREEAPRRDEVRRHMAHDPLLVRRDTPLPAVTDALLSPRPRPVVVVDEERRPLGVITQRELLMVLAVTDRRARAETPTPALRDGQAPLRQLAQSSGVA